MFKFLEQLRHRTIGYPELSIRENLELKKRGFYVKEFFKFRFIFLKISTYAGLSLFVSPIILDNNKWKWVMLLFICFLLLLLLRDLYYYILLGKFFYCPNGIFAYKRMYISMDNIPNFKRFGEQESFINSSKPITGHTKGTKFTIESSSTGKSMLLLSPIIGFIIGIAFSAGYKTALVALLLYLGFILFIYLLRQLIEHFHPLYAFGNLGEKIQKLTPEIEKESKIIQVEFEKDQNFSVLHSGFEKLSSTFSEIVELVVKLEKVEKRANKGNLFDSEKYINSLRGDIVNPLVELKRFLEKQREQLVESQRELSRVRVGGGEERGTKELSSKRSEIILKELDENIERLWEMIGKMG